MRTLLKAILTVAVVGGFLAGSMSAEAGFKLRIDDGVGAPYDVFIDDSVPGPADGSILFSGSVGVFTVVVTNAESKDFFAPGTDPLMHLNVSVSKSGSSGAGSLVIEVTDTDFTNANTQGGASVQQTFGVSGSFSNMEYQTFFDNIDNGEFHAHGPSSPLNSTSSTFVGTDFVAFSTASPFSIYQRVEVNAGAGAGAASGDFFIRPVPLPGAVILVLTGIPALGVGAWIRRRKSTVAA
jgi:hypothetical protein